MAVLGLLLEQLEDGVLVLDYCNCGTSDLEIATA